MSAFKDKKLIKKQTYTKTQTYVNSILEYFEYFCQMSSKSNFELYPFKVGAFFETSSNKQLFMWSRI